MTGFKKLGVKTLAGAAASIVLFTGATFASECSITITQLGKQLPIRRTLKIVKEKKVSKGVCEIIASTKTPFGTSYLPIYYFENREGVILGAYFKNGENLTNTEISKLRYADMKKAFAEVKKELPSVAMAEYKPKNANGKVLYAFMDPLCPYCKMAEKHLKELADKSGYTVALVPFIVHGKAAKEKVESFICSKSTFNDWLNNNYGKGGDKCSKADDMIRKAAKIAVRIHFGGTPTFLTSDGQVVEGANIQKLKQILEVRR